MAAIVSEVGEVSAGEVGEVAGDVGEVGAGELVYINILLIVDRSGSMQSMNGGHIEATSAFIKKQQKNAKELGVRCEFTLCAFDDKVEMKTWTDILNCELVGGGVGGDGAGDGACDGAGDGVLNDMLEPRGTTRLIDTVIEQIDQQKKEYAIWMNGRTQLEIDEGARGERILAVITDGQDNVSLKSARDMNIAIKKLRDDGVSCMFLAANQDAITQGAIFGFGAGASLNMDANRGGIMGAMESCSAAIERHTSGGDGSFTQAERQVSAPSQLLRDDVKDAAERAYEARLREMVKRREEKIKRNRRLMHMRACGYNQSNSAPAVMDDVNAMAIRDKDGSLANTLKELLGE